MKTLEDWVITPREAAKGVKDSSTKEQFEGFCQGQITHFINRYKEGSIKSLFDAIQFCGAAGIPIPDFFAEKFSAAMDKIQFRDAMSLDEAFGWVKPSPKKFNADKKRKDLRLPVYAACIEASKKGMPLKKNSNKKSAFDYTAEKFDISPGQAEKYYGEWNKVFRDLEAHEIKDLKK